MIEFKSAAVSAWENEGGAIDCHHAGNHYGRRIEADKSWTVYHVFTGVPAAVDGYILTGLNGLSAMSCTLSLNFHSASLKPTKWLETRVMPQARSVPVSDYRSKL